MSDKSSLARLSDSARSRFHSATSQLPPLSDLSHQLRTATAQLHSADTLKLHLVIKGIKGVVQDGEALAREETSLGKALGVWAEEVGGKGQSGVAITVEGWGWTMARQAEASRELTTSIERSRVCLKVVRNFEDELTPRRAKITALHQSLTTLRANPRTEPAALAKLIAELTAEQDQVATFEASLLVLRRTKTKELMEIYLKGQRLYAQTMMVLAQGGDGIPTTSPPAPAQESSTTSFTPVPNPVGPALPPRLSTNFPLSSSSAELNTSPSQHDSTEVTPSWIRAGAIDRARVTVEVGPSGETDLPAYEEQREEDDAAREAAQILAREREGKKSL